MIFEQSSFRLAERDFIRARIDHSQQVAFFYILSFFKRYVDKLPIKPALDHDGVERSNRSQSGEINRQIARLGFGHCHRDNLRSHSLAASAATPAFPLLLWLLLCRLAATQQQNQHANRHTNAPG